MFSSNTLHPHNTSGSMKAGMGLCRGVPDGPSVEPVVSHIEVLSQSLGDCFQNKNQIYFYPEDVFSFTDRMWYKYLHENWEKSMILCTATLKQNCPVRLDCSSALSNYLKEILKEKCLTFRIKKKESNNFRSVARAQHPFTASPAQFWVPCTFLLKKRRR